MPSTPLLGITELTPNQTGKETTINNALIALESATNATLAVDMSAGNVTLSAAQFAGSFIFKSTGMTAARILNLPAQINGNNVQRVFAVRNASSYAATIQVTGGTGTTVIVPAGETRLLDVDGAGNVKQVALLPNGTSVITDTTTARAIGLTDISCYIRMNNAAANQVTLPSDATASAPLGSRVFIEQMGAGATSFVAGAGATIRTPGTLALRARYSLGVATKVAIDTWALDGDLAGTGASLAALSDVDVATTAPTNGQSLIYDATAMKWKPGAGSGGGGSSGAVSGTDTGPVGSLGVPTARYWRVKANSTDGANGIQTALATVEFREAVGVSQQNTGGTPISGGDLSGSYPPSNAFDTNSATFWCSPALSSSWIGYDFGTPKTIAEVMMLPRQDYTGQSPANFTVDYSSDGSAWTTAFTVTGATWTLAAKVFDNPYAGTTGLTEKYPKKLAALNDVSKTAPTNGQVLTYNNSTGNWEPTTPSSGGGGGSSVTWANGSGNKRLFMSATAVNGNGTPNTSLGAAPSNAFYFNNAASCSVTFDFLTAKVVQAIAFLFDLVAGNQGNWTVEASPDNATWTTLIASQAYTPISTNGLANVIFDFSSNTTAYRYYRVRQLSGTGSSSAYVNQFLFKSEPIGS